MSYDGPVQSMSCALLILTLSSILPLNSEARPVFISSPQLDQFLRSSKEVRVIDARGTTADAPYVVGAIVTSWKEIRAGWLRDGRLAPTHKARAYYSLQGVDVRHPIVVYGAAHQGWGEEGRVWWDLTILGHPKVYILDGGINAWLRYGGKTSKTAAPPRVGYFPESVPPSTSLRLNAQNVLSLLQNKKSIILDVRTYKEYHGATPYLSPRGGHIPGAKHFPWKHLLTSNGLLRSEQQITQLMRHVGITPQTSLVAAYCTGGVRSAFTIAVLTHLGIQAANYDGSWWDWSSQDYLPISTTHPPLEKVNSEN
ncbi:MAG: hypothetical protein KTR25_18710 [Myxococcales bacterium]|nr:hypothetical protein [Myxococcales bacterium]